MAIRTDTRTIHTIHIEIPDSALEKVESTDEVEIVLHGRIGSTGRKRLTFRDIESLLSDNIQAKVRR